MNYDKNFIEKRIEITNKTKVIVKKLLYVILILLLYNVFLISKSSLSTKNAKDIFGYRAYIIITDSMKPNIHLGDIVIATKVPEEKLKTGDIITFSKNGENISHRIIGIEEEPEGKKYITKGDNNNIEDSEKIKYNDIEGMKIFVIPFLGKLILILRNKIYIVLFFLLILILWLYTVKIEKKKRTRREKKKYEDKLFQRKKDVD